MSESKGDQTFGLSVQATDKLRLLSTKSQDRCRYQPKPPRPFFFISGFDLKDIPFALFINIRFLQHPQAHSLAKWMWRIMDRKHCQPLADEEWKGALWSGSRNSRRDQCFIQAEIRLLRSLHISRTSTTPPPRETCSIPFVELPYQFITQSVLMHPHTFHYNRGATRASLSPGISITSLLNFREDFSPARNYYRFLLSVKKLRMRVLLRLSPCSFITGPVPIHTRFYKHSRHWENRG